MPHISHKELKSEDLSNLFLQLVKVINTIGTERKSEALFKGFFTETEKIMFAKRLAIIFLLNEGISKPFISDTLFVSPSTVDRVSLKYEIGEYDYIVRIIKKNNQTIFEVIETLISNSASSYVGKRRLAWMNKLEEKYDKKIFRY